MASGTKSNERDFDPAGRAVRCPLDDELRDLRYGAASRIVSFTRSSSDGTVQPALDQRLDCDENSRLKRPCDSGSRSCHTLPPDLSLIHI